MTKPLLSNTAYGATLLIALQAGTRAVTFGLNQLLIRYLSPELLGIATQLEVFSISVLFFARESLRVVIQRQKDAVGKDGGVSKDGESKEDQDDHCKGQLRGESAAGQTQTVVNLSYVSIYLGFCLLLPLAWMFSEHTIIGDSTTHIYYREALYLHAIAVICELLSEPFFVVIQQKSKFETRARVESIATAVRCLVTCGSVMLASSMEVDIGVLPFALGQWTFSLTLLALYALATSKLAKEGGFSFTMRSLYSRNDKDYVMSYFSKTLLVLGSSLLLQNFVKHLLTQGDTILISYLASPQVIGVYALASNYGSLVARMVFQPIEEISRSHFGKMLSTSEGTPSETIVRKASSDLHRLFKFYSLLSISAVAIGPTVAPLLLRYVAGSGWATSGAGEVLAIYCYYIPLLAFNGITEAFVSAVATKSEIDRQSTWMLAFSAGFGLAGVLFLRVFSLGAKGLVWANIMNMSLRIIWSGNFIRGYLSNTGENFDIAKISPHAVTIAAGLGTGSVLWQVEKSFDGTVGDLIQSGSIALGFALVLLISERYYFLQCYKLIRT